MFRILKRVVLLGLLGNFMAIQPMEQSNSIKFATEAAGNFLEAIKNGLISANDRVIRLTYKHPVIAAVPVVFYTTGGIYFLYKSGKLQRLYHSLHKTTKRHPNTTLAAVYLTAGIALGYSGFGPKIGKAYINSVDKIAASILSTTQNELFTGIALGCAGSIAAYQLYKKFGDKIKKWFKPVTAGTTGTTSLYNVGSKQEQLENQLLKNQSNLADCIDILNKYIKSSNSINAQDLSGGETILHKVITHNRHAELVKVLLKQFKADPNIQDNDGSTPLFAAVASGAFDCCKLLLEHGADVNKTDNYNNTALHLSVTHYFKNICRLLLKFNAKVDIKNNNNDTPLYYAAQKHDEELCKLLVAHGAQYDWQNVLKSLVIFNSATGNTTANDNDSMVKLLIDSGLPANIIGHNNTTPLHIAVINEWYDCAQALLERGADVNSADFEGNTPLIIAVMHQNEKIVALLLKYKADVNQQNNDRETPVMIACDQSENVEILKELLSVSTNLAIANRYGDTALHYAINAKEHEYVKLLLEKGADINQRTDQNRTPLMVACQNEDEECVKLLLEKNADVLLVDENGNTAFWHAPKNSNIARLVSTANSKFNISPASVFTLTGNSVTYDLYQKIIKNNPDQCIIHDLQNINFNNNLGTALFKKTAIKLVINKNLISALQQNNEQSISDALNNGAEVNYVSDHGLTPLMIAIAHNNFPIIADLLHRGAFVSVKDDEGNTPLHSAAKMCNGEIAALIIQYGADVDAQNDAGQTPLFIASSNGHDTVVQQLLKAGALVEIVDAVYKNTPLLIAVASNHYSTAKLLIDAGAKVNVADKLGSALHYAYQHNNAQLIELLIQAGADVNAVNADGHKPIDLLI